MTNVLIFTAALALAIGGTPLARRLAAHAGITDKPSPRKVHAEPIPLLGGLAIYVAVILALVAFGERQAMAELAGILVGATLVSFLGLWDDSQPLRPSLKLFGQIGAVGVVMASGVRVALTGEPVVDGLITALWLIGVTNAVNFADNMDGVSGGIAAIASGTFLLLAVQNDQLLVGPLSAAVLGACVGFLVYNFNPASIFMGDAGSMFLGFVLAAIGIKLRFPGRPVDVTWMVPVFVMAVPLFDLALVLVARLRRRVNPFTTGGTDHLSHRLVALGRLPREATLIIYLLAAVAGGLGLFASHADRAEAWTAMLAMLAVFAWGIWRLEFAGGGVRGISAPQAPSPASIDAAEPHYEETDNP